MPLATLTVTGLPMAVAPCKTVKVSVPRFTVPAGLFTVALSVTVWLPELNPVEALAAAVLLETAPMVRACVLSVAGLKLAVPLKTAWMT